MTSGTKLVLGLVAGVMLLIGSPIIFLFAVACWSDYWFQHVSPMAAQAVRNTDEATKEEFRRRLQATFPVGSSAEEMKQELARQGFRQIPGKYRAGPAMILEQHSSMACIYYFQVFWTSSDTGRLAGVDADLNHSCL